MQHLARRLTVFCAFAAAAIPIFAQSAPGYTLRESLASAKVIQEVIARSERIPLRKRYGDMNEAETDAVRSWYTAMRSTDEPPWPELGLEPFVRLLSQALEKLPVAGDLYLIADIDKNGDAIAVKAYGSLNADMTRFAASALMLQKFKPALCDSQPCAQQFPFALKFVLD